MGCGLSRFDLEESVGSAPIDPPDTPKLLSGDKLQGNAHSKEGDVGVTEAASNGRRSVSSLVKGNHFFKRLAPNASIDEEKERIYLGEETGSVGEDFDDDVVWEDSILMGHASPSFRVYCDYPPSLADAGDEETKANASPSDSIKGSVGLSCQTTRKRKARGRIKNALRRGGSAGMKKLLPPSTRIRTHEHAVHPIARPTRSINDLLFARGGVLA